jgi:hypothetical protein
MNDHFEVFDIERDMKEGEWWEGQDISFCQ